MMSAVSSKKKKTLSPLEKRIPENPRYANIKHRVDSGASLNKYLAKIEDIKTNYRYKKGEIFKRMKVTTFAHLVLQVENFKLKKETEFDNEFIPNGGDNESSRTPVNIESEDIRAGSGGHMEDLPTVSRTSGSPTPSLPITESDFGASRDTARSTFQNVITGIGELDAKKLPTMDSEVVDDKPPAVELENSSPYLLLDVRDSDAFNSCRIISARNYPTAMLSRTLNYYTKEILAYKNTPGKIIIVYDEDERIAPMAATTLVERGIDNLFMLSGGLNVMSQKIPTGMITGSLPPSCLGKGPNSAPSRSASRVSTSKQPVVMATQDEFSSDDLAEIERHVDEALVPSDYGSRMSSRSAMSRKSDSISIRSESTVTPWR